MGQAVLAFQMVPHQVKARLLTFGHNTMPTLRVVEEGLVVI